LDMCGDADDLFLDDERARVYASCGAGSVDVFKVDGRTLVQSGRVATKAGARTSLFVPEWNQLFVAARATEGRSAEILVYAIGD
jgi:hypothetical protein